MENCPGGGRGMWGGFVKQEERTTRKTNTSFFDIPQVELMYQLLACQVRVAVGNSGHTQVAVFQCMTSFGR